MGIPCVVGTKTASRTIRDGQRIRIDGDRGRVEVLG
jgi:pyruvate,water dikinase